MLIRSPQNISTDLSLSAVWPFLGRPSAGLNYEIISQSTIEHVAGETPSTPWEERLDYSCRITIFLFIIEHLLEIFETRNMCLLGISLLTFMQLSAAYVAGRTETFRSTLAPQDRTLEARSLSQLRL
jgi:hypothetical protein